MSTIKGGTGRRRVSVEGEDSYILCFRVPKSWAYCLGTLETDEVKKPALLRRALKGYLRCRGAFPEPKMLKGDVYF